jgi:hypothetical protein
MIEKGRGTGRGTGRGSGRGTGRGTGRGEKRVGRFRVLFCSERRVADCSVVFVWLVGMRVVVEEVRALMVLYSMMSVPASSKNNPAPLVVMDCLLREMSMSAIIVTPKHESKASTLHSVEEE